MILRSKLALTAGVAVFAAISALPATAACKKMGFTVNDYGKDGPTKDAKDLLDGHVAKWAAEQGIEKYTIGKKDVKCELYLNLILFDEHTCTASATVCWGGDKPKDGQETTAGKKPSTKAAKAPKSTEPASTDSAGAAAPAAGDAPIRTSNDTTAPPADSTTGGADAAPAQAAPAETAPAQTDKSVETGAIPAAGGTNAEAPPAVDAAEAAAQAAERAAAAAERAAAAAERAAAALAASEKATGAGAAPVAPDSGEAPSP